MLTVLLIKLAFPTLRDPSVLVSFAAIADAVSFVGVSLVMGLMAFDSLRPLNGSLLC